MHFGVGGVPVRTTSEKRAIVIYEQAFDRASAADNPKCTAMTSQLQHHVTEFLRAINEMLEIAERYEARRRDIRRWRFLDTSDWGRYVSDENEVARDAESKMVGRRLRLVHHGAVVLNDFPAEDEIVEQVSRLLKLDADEATYFRRAFEKLSKAGDLAGFLALAQYRFETASERQVRLTQIEKARVDLTAYCLLRFPPSQGKSKDGEAPSAG